MFIVGSQVCPTEWWAMVPLNVSVHAGGDARPPGRAGATAAGWSWKMTYCAAAGSSPPGASGLPAGGG